MAVDYMLLYFVESAREVAGLVCQPLPWAIEAESLDEG